jgi:cyclohexanone monooxygenase
MWITDCIKKMESEGHSLCSPKKEAEDEWSAHVAEVHVQTLMNEGDQVNSWMMGANIENHEPRVLIYFGGADVYYDKLRESVDAGFPELAFDTLP